ncbi:MAG: hypothetical protein ACM35H_10955 [Bacteroidota bacterium]
MKTDSVASIASVPGSAGARLQARRLLLRRFLGAPLLVLTAGLAGCGTRKDLPEERRTRGKFGHRGD